MAEGIRDDARVRRLIEQANERRVPIERVPRAQLDDLTNGANHQGVVLLASRFHYVPLEVVISGSGPVLALDHLQDPQNFGTLLRASEATQVAGVIIPEDRSVAVTSAVVNASAGAVEHLNVALVPSFGQALDHAKRGGRWLIGLDRGADSVDVFRTEVPEPAVVLVGSEGDGLTPIHRKACDLIVSIPMAGKVGSLNASTAGSIVLFELFRRRSIAAE
jgi:23S rRNA (guanosine2251-2'-O)-methyltransferase